ncbi:MAG TPA: HAD-IA family hydrolase, partial [Bryobacteraceae bacterium]|nr:HAD-IA family hydrolase [Bryobacteraceae bacterium]
KPDPQVFLSAAARLGVEPAHCVVVEDAAAGIEAARRAGIRSIGIERGGQPLPADLVAPSLAALPPKAFDALISP